MIPWLTQRRRPTAPASRYTMDDVGRIVETDCGFTEACVWLPELRRQLFDRIAEPFGPFHSL